MHSSLLATVFLLFPFLSNAANDWSTACAGTCSYEMGDGVNTAWGSILLDGAPEVVSDISTAAGWSIMDCNSTSQDTQIVRLVCHDPDAGCAQLFDGGAENTVVRLPDDCADAPFARVVNVTTSTNQTLTPKVAERVARKKRDTAPEVMTVVIDYNFALLPASRGTISMTALATTNPLQRPMADAQVLRRALGYGESGSLNSRRANSPGELVKREILRRDLFANFISGNYIPPGTTASAFNTSSTSNKVEKLAIGSWNHDFNKTFDVLNIQQSFPVIDVGLHCDQNGDIPAFDAKLNIQADVTVQATVSVGFIVAGSIIPPAITKAAFTSALDGNAQVDFKVSTVAQGSFNTGLIPFWSSGMAGLSIPGILDVGPTFSINGQGIGEISVCTDAVIAANYQFPSLSMVYPQDEGPSNGQASQGTAPSPLSLSIGGSASLSGTVSAHVIPRVDLGVNVLSGAASASVFLELDGYGSMNMNLSMDESTTTVVQPSSTDAVAHVVIPTSTLTSTSTSSDTASSDTTQASTTSTPPVPTSTLDTSTLDSSTLDSSSTNTDTTTSNTTSIITSTTISTSTSLPVAADDLALPPTDNGISSPSPDEKEETKSCPSRRVRHRQRKRELIIPEKRASPNYSGCIGMAMGVKIVAGAQGKLFSFWKDSTSFDLFSQEWSLLNKCFNTSSKRSLPYLHGPIVPSRPSSLPRRDLVDKLICPLIENAITDALTADNQLV